MKKIKKNKAKIASTAKEYTDATCATADTECGVDDADEDADGDCPDGKTTDKVTKTMSFTPGTCMIHADDPDGIFASAAILAHSWKIVCSGGKGVVKLFTDSACATAIASATVVDTALEVVTNGDMPAGVTMDWKFGAALDAGMAATNCFTMVTFAVDKVSCVFAACSLPLRDAGQAQARWFLDLTARFGRRQQWWLQGRMKPQPTYMSQCLAPWW